MSLQTVHLRINDAATGRPTPVRLRVTGPDGTYYPPFGHSADFAIGRGEDVGGNVLIGKDRWAYVDGTCEIALPAGQVLVEAAKGPEFKPLRQEVHLPAGKLALRFTIERWADLRSEGWYSGDIRAHFLPPHAALLEGAAEDLAVVHLLAAEVQLSSISDGRTHTTFPNLAAFSGQRPCLETPDYSVAVNTHNHHPVLGSLGLLHCHRAVFPLTFGGPDHTDDWSLADWCDQCHRKHGLVVWTAAFRSETGLVGEALADLILGKVDALEIDPAARSVPLLRAWYGLLNASLRVPIIGASAKDDNRTPLGVLRTYAQLAPGTEFDTAAWVEAVRAGRTFVTGGPLVRFTVDDVDPGTVIERPADARPLRLRAEATGLEPFERLEVVVNGVVAASAPGQGSPCSAVLEVELPTGAGGWLAVRCLSTAGRLAGFAHTSPVSVRVAGRESPADPAELAAIVRNLDLTRDWVEREGRFESDRRRTQLLGVFDRARQQVLARGG